ncbi:hypothetical protein FHX48_000079 [Microbacterium halimionae]|uniref:Type VII secretion integral membrane protein EccD n=1 Tax=Microbacterium halimionae TaxID=1526413 RepID=A0A7W3JLC4_9MICO|nr:hypothetical protein [Microbacterium halimionae]MBA8815027.1 hypothetical protein [Microbacterium halimionae]NII94182.1 hypothetical protein [Microbacterium halimionae]
MPTETVERRRVAIMDGENRHDLLLPLDATLSDAFRTVGIAAHAGRDVIVELSGREVSALSRAKDLTDGTVLVLVNLSERAATTRSRRRLALVSGATAVGPWWALTAIGVLIAALVLLLPSAFDEGVRAGLCLVAATGAATAGVFFAVRATPHSRRNSSAIISILLLAFAAGVAAVPNLPSATTIASVFVGLLFAAVLAGVLRLVSRDAAISAELAATTAILLILSAVWAAALFLHFNIETPAAITLGLAPVALRVLTATLVDVPPGVFIDYARYQSTRWSVRQTLPDEINSVTAIDARDLVARSTGRLVAGTVVFSIAAVLCAPLALSSFESSDPLVLSGRIALAVTTVTALLLGARRSSIALVRWLPRAAAGAIATTAIYAATRGSAETWTLALAGVCLLVGAATAFAVVPASRGAQSLFWSRLGDTVEWIAVALSLPAALLAADTIDILRGMVNS